MRPAAEEEFVAFVSERRAELVRWATTLTTGDLHLAEDLVQNTLTRVYRRWAQARRNPVAYARRSLVNAFIDHQRRGSSHRERSRSELPEGAQLAGRVTRDESQQVADRQALLMALRTLPAGMRATVTLRYVEDVSVEETAQILGCSTGTVKSQAAKGLAKLRTALAPPSEGGAPTAPSSPTRVPETSGPSVHTTEGNPS